MASATATKNPSPGTAAAPRAGIRGPWLLAGALITVLSLVAALIFSGAAASGRLLDPGAVTRWGLPIALTVHNVAVATVVGALLFAVVLLPKELKPLRSTPAGRLAAVGTAAPPAPEHPAFTRALTLAAVAAVVWTLSAIVVLVLTYSDIAGLPPSSGSDYTAQLAFYMTSLPTGQAWLAICIFAAVVATLCFGVRSLNALAITLVLALLGLTPQALIGHASSGSDHEGAVNSLLLHLTGVALWFGGIIALAVISGTLNKLTGPVLKRFSTMALFAFVTVFASGVINAAIRITSWNELFTSAYGQLILIKTAATIVLGVIGYMHRQWILPRLESGRGSLSARRVLWQLILGELIIMGSTSGIAVALSRSAPPEPTSYAPDATPAVLLTGYELPPALSPSRWVTEWRLDWLWVAFVLVATAAYLAGVLKLRRRGDGWPLLRTVSWLLGMVALTYVTSGGPAVYGRVLFSAHMVDHMMLMLVSPLFMVLGAPISLGLKALRPRGDGSRGVREWILVLVHSKFSALVTHPLFAAANFAGSLVLFYYTAAFGYAMRDHVGHELMMLHFTITGYLFILTMIGSDPIPRRAPYPLRLLLLLATMAFHAFFGVSLMSATALLQGSYFGNMGRTWGASALADQQTGGGIAWGIGEIPTLLIAIGVAMMWSRSDERETKRKDRAADRNNDADLTAYNDMFAQLAERDTKLHGDAVPGGDTMQQAKQGETP
ncbi:bifunctional copper resistance protein CopD/cytochrome c oxidase assembly protein [Paenarthrobacter sp. Z7-10]|uniref:cytochrome c oxidase assembly protein n=1 Tax=Paenarthrobacter sp. Z7-10 TaxID=2787635 RepID=UPI0022A8E7DF|nr:cytochrome c oxidase assembly protein [Paenarthrobacter sp. Z7-10]MCZ2403130.1 bifunctional copper resistance protein CopD/cytochrome c oxidase assembly protein [Paenarthrobacter sp. Z7-10]